MEEQDMNSCLTSNTSKKNSTTSSLFFLIRISQLLLFFSFISSSNSFTSFIQVYPSRSFDSKLNSHGNHPSINTCFTNIAETTLYGSITATTDLDNKAVTSTSHYNDESEYETSPIKSPSPNPESNSHSTINENNAEHNHDNMNTDADGGNDKNDNNKKTSIKAAAARHLLSRSANLKGTNAAKSKSKLARTHTSVGPIKGRQKGTGRGSGGSKLAGGKILSSLRKNAAVAATLAEKTKQESETSSKQNQANQKDEKNDSSNSSPKTSSPPALFNEPDVSVPIDNNDDNYKWKASFQSGQSKDKGIIKSTIKKILHNQENKRQELYQQEQVQLQRQQQQQQQQQQQYTKSKKKTKTAGTNPSTTSSTFGLFGEKQLPEPMPKPFPGTILTYPTDYFLKPTSSSFKKLKKGLSTIAPSSPISPLPSIESKSPIQDAVTVRVATRLDDSSIANLRLSVFSKYTSNTSAKYADELESLRYKFLSRSCQVLESRRNLGAICLVASVPKPIKNEFVTLSRNKQRGWAEKKNGSSTKEKRRLMEFWQSLSEWEREEEYVIGSAECSVHEFYGTDLGKQRLQNRILYITEVAVSPNTRMVGVGKKILQVINRNE